MVKLFYVVHMNKGRSGMFKIKNTKQWNEENLLNQSG
jgi:hypothetical protein